MLTNDLIAKVKEHLNIVDSSRDLTVSDIIQDAINYCNLIELPAELEPFIRRKVQGIINYEAENGTGTVFDVSSIKEGDTTTSYNTNQVSKETVYGLSAEDKKRLQSFRRLKW